MPTPPITDKAAWADLGPHNTLSVPAKCRHLTSANSLDGLIEAVADARAESLPFLVLGEGSNTVFVGDYHGTVILNRLLGLEVVKESDSSVFVRVAAGENWHSFVEHCVENAWHGLENLALIPGTVGAAPIQNIGAYGVEVKDTIVSVEALDLDTLQVDQITNKDCRFAYRESRFKRAWSNTKIVTSVTFKLSKVTSSLVFSYPALKERAKKLAQGELTLKDVFNGVVSLRSEKLPDPKNIPNAGSFFKNPIVDVQTYHALKEKYPKMVAFEQGNAMKLAAAWLIDSAGWKAREIHGVRVHHNQALVITNPEGMSGLAIENFAKEIQSDIKGRYGVQLEIEPRLIRS